MQKLYSNKMKKLFFFTVITLLTQFLFAQNAVRFTQLSKKGNVLIFLPHIGCSSEMWKDIGTHYQNKYAVYLVDFAGFNGISPIDSNYTKTYVKDLQQFIRHKKFKNVTLVGQNYGAFVAIKTSLDKSLNIKAVIASDFYPNLSMVLDPDISSEKLQLIKNSIRQSIMQNDEATFAANQKQTAEMMNFMKAEDVNRFVQWQLRSDRKTLAETLCEQFDADLRPDLKNNEIPILVFTTWYFAKTYKNIPMTEAEAKVKEMYGNAPNITHAICEDAKDFMANDQPQWFITQMDKFLKTNIVEAKDI